MARHAGGGVNSLPLAQLRSAGTRDAGEQSHRDDAGHDRRNRRVLTIELGADCFAHAEGLNPETTKIGSGTHRRRCSCSSNMTKSSSCYVVASIAMKRLLRDSHSVGCAKTPSRSAVYGSFAIIATSIADITSPPSTPSTAAPRIWFVSPS